MIKGRRHLCLLFTSTTSMNASWSSKQKVSFILPVIVTLTIPFQELDLVGIAKGYGLPHLPRMPELKGVDISSFVPHPSASREIKYKDRAREKQRRQKLERIDQGGVLILLFALQYTLCPVPSRPPPPPRHVVTGNAQYTVEPFHKGHFGGNRFILCWEVDFIRG